MYKYFLTHCDVRYNTGTHYVVRHLTVINHWPHGFLTLHRGGRDSTYYYYYHSALRTHTHIYIYAYILPIFYAMRSSTAVKIRITYY
jgi:hypothetical protein